VFLHGLLDGLCGRLGAGGLLFANNSNLSYVPWVDGVPSHWIAYTWYGRLGVGHQKLIVCSERSYKFPKRFLVVVVRAPCKTVLDFIDDRSLRETECNWVHVIFI